MGGSLASLLTETPHWAAHNPLFFLVPENVWQTSPMKHSPLELPTPGKDGRASGGFLKSW